MDEIVTLNTLFGWQRRLMDVLKVPEVQQPHVKDPIFGVVAAGVVSEAVEVLNEVTDVTKPWKTVSIEDATANVKEEMADVLFMLMELWTLAGYEPSELFKTYRAKLKKNLIRVLKSEHSTVDQVVEAAKFLGELEAEENPEAVKIAVVGIISEQSESPGHIQG